ncbi:putative transporter MCH4 [Beauveria bassiana]|uniref:Putative transporter MCH4 n=1 Tax=Beauveria bassiana TaxID=176275 RepID=A0A2N6NUK5_BEABA|nr:putative transporter MCH4 [Beauveria bassiana]
MMTSLATQYWQLFLAQGLVVGLGAGCLFLPSVSIVATYFTTKRALVTGIVAAGGSIASVVYPIVFQKLLSQVGFAWAIPQKSRALLDLSAFVSAPFDALCLGLVLAFIGLYVPFFHVIIYAQSKFKFDGDILLYLLSVLNAASVAG